MTALLLFLSTFLLVATLAAQNLFIVHGRYVAAFFNSAAIGTMNLLLFKLAPDASALEAFGFIAGGPFGVVTAMYLVRARKYDKGR
jgi:hypothetical protein